MLERAHHDCGVSPNPHLMENANANRPEFRGVTAVFNAQAVQYALDIRKALSGGDGDRLPRALPGSQSGGNRRRLYESRYRR